MLGKEKSYISDEMFDNVVKNAIVEYYKQEYSQEVNRNDITSVFYSYVLGFRKCTAILINGDQDGVYFECTYDANTGQLYFDAYEKASHKVFDVVKPSMLEVGDLTGVIKILGLSMNHHNKSLYDDSRKDLHGEVKPGDVAYVRNVFTKGRKFVYQAIMYEVVQVTTSVPMSKKGMGSVKIQCRVID